MKVLGCIIVLIAATIVVILVRSMMSKSGGTPPKAAPAPPPPASPLPPNVVDDLERLGRFEFDPQTSPTADPHTSPIVDPHTSPTDTAGLAEFVADLHARYRKDPNTITEALAAAVLPVGGWPAYGAARLITDLIGADLKHPRYGEIMTASLQFLRTNNVPRNRLTSAEWNLWEDHNEAGEPWLAEIAPPPREQSGITDLAIQETRKIAKIWNSDDSQVIYVERDEAGGYVLLADTPISADNPARKRFELRHASTLYDIYVEFGRGQQVAPYWSDPELRPYFPLPAAKI